MQMINQYRAYKNYNAYKIQPLHGRGDTFLSSLTRFGAGVNKWVRRAGLILGILATLTNPVAPAVAIFYFFAGKKVEQYLNYLASLMDIEHLLGRRDIQTIKNMMKEARWIQRELKPYKSWEEVPPNIKKDVKDYMNEHYEKIKHLEAVLAGIEADLED